MQEVIFVGDFHNTDIVTGVQFWNDSLATTLRLLALLAAFWWTLCGGRQRPLSAWFYFRKVQRSRNCSQCHKMWPSDRFITLSTKHFRYRSKRQTDKRYLVPVTHLQPVAADLWEVILPSCLLISSHTAFTSMWLFRCGPTSAQSGSHNTNRAALAVDLPWFDSSMPVRIRSHRWSHRVISRS